MRSADPFALMRQSRQDAELEAFATPMTVLQDSEGLMAAALACAKETLSFVGQSLSPEVFLLCIDDATIALVSDGGAAALVGAPTTMAQAAQHGAQQREQQRAHAAQHLAKTSTRALPTCAPGSTGAGSCAGRLAATGADRHALGIATGRARDQEPPTGASAGAGPRNGRGAAQARARPRESPAGRASEPTTAGG